ncbi:hypothetical protein BGW80DRAFT_597814 [Lactifluus volemus]|nr:hypothetical protein BGW80DRAFT_597814 [Lactifluus volemus]
MKRLGTRVNFIPVIANADTLTQNDFVHLQGIRDVIAAQNIRIYQPPIEVDDEALVLHCRNASTGQKSEQIWGEGPPSATPQRYYSRPLTIRPSGVWTFSVEPMMENGIASARMRACSALPWSRRELPSLFPYFVLQNINCLHNP